MLSYGSDVLTGKEKSGSIKVSMKFLSTLKWRLKRVQRVVESNPYTYWFSKKFLTRISLFLPHEVDFYGFRHLIKQKAGLFLDIGANDGISCRSFRKFNNTWKILSIEANPLHEVGLGQLKKKVRNFDFLIAAVGKTSGEQVTLYVPAFRFIPIHRVASLAREQVEKSLSSLPFASDRRRLAYKEVATRTLRVDDLSLSPTIVKIDVEGAELNALLGMEQTIQTARPFFLVEVKSDQFPSVNEFFSKKSYRSFGYNVKRDAFEAFRGDLFRCFFFFPSEKCDGLPIL